MKQATGLSWKARKAWFRLWWAAERLATGGTHAARGPGVRTSGGPDFVCVGMQKAGTSWLFDQMNARRDVWMPPVKELNYFTGRCLKPGSISKIKAGGGSLPEVPRLGDSWRRIEFLERFSGFQERRCGIEWYRRLFELAGDRVTGDVSPGYSKLDEPRVAELCALLPEARFILIVRDPVDRFWSSVCMKVRRNKVPGESLQSWASFKPVFEELMRNPESRDCYGSRIWSAYARHLPRERLRYWFFDDVCRRPETVLDEICEYLGIGRGQGALEAGFNRKSGFAKFPMPADVAANLVAHFFAEYEQGAAVFGGHAVNWLEKAKSR